MKTFLFRTALVLGGLLFIVSSSWAAERALLANPDGPTLAAASANDRAMANKLTRLRTKARESGNVRLIVGVRTAFAPEGKLAAVEAATQRLDIGKAQAAVLRRLAVVHGREKKVSRFTTIPFLGLEVNAAEFETLASDSNVLSIEEDVLRAPTLEESSPLIGATSSWSAGCNGCGQVVAILDTGVDKTHPFLSGKVVSEACYSTNNVNYSSSTLCPGGATESTASGSGINCNIEGCEHGTHVAGIAAGSKDDTFSGVARGANLIAIQVFSRFDSTYYCGGIVPCVLSFVSDQIKGLERVYDLRTSYSIAAVNMSMGGGQYFDQAMCDNDNSAVKAVIDNLRAVGVATVISSGNDASTNSLSAPGCVSTAVSVGSTWDASGLSATFSICSEPNSTVDKVACYSNSASFLNLLAPGSAINSSIPGPGYAIFHGTSMAAPQVTGAWALLKQAVPHISVNNALNALTTTGVPVTDYRYPFIVKPRINLVAALASISPGPPYTLTVNSSGAYHVAIGSFPTDYAGTTNYSKTGIAEGTTITLTAPVTSESATFSSWKCCDSASGVTCTVNMNTSKSVMAIYSTPFPWPMFVPAITGGKK
ncbi:MAG: S8 family serine peptidase [Deltaproteobacteria bacterium]|nr:S8 family serine peptidase [Deltaproteobacteria bacterium]